MITNVELKISSFNFVKLLLRHYIPDIYGVKVDHQTSKRIIKNGFVDGSVYVQIIAFIIIKPMWYDYFDQIDGEFIKKVIFFSYQDVQPIGAVLLTTHTVESCSDVGRPFAFRVTSGESLPLYLAADDEQAATHWIAVLSHAAKQSDPWLEISTRNLRLPPNGKLKFIFCEISKSCWFSSVKLSQFKEVKDRSAKIQTICRCSATRLFWLSYEIRQSLASMVQTILCAKGCLPILLP